MEVSFATTLTKQTCTLMNLLLLFSLLDAIILGASRMEHLEANLSACEEGPLDTRALSNTT